MSDHASSHASDESKRDFLYLAAGAMGAVGTAAVAWPIIDSMNPSADVLALSTVEIDVSQLDAGSALTVLWRGKPVFVRHRTEEEIAAARDVDVEVLPDPQTDEERVVKAEYLVMVGVCTHLGCVPLGNNAGENKGEFGGWFCPCHGSHYDTSGRIRKGPAPANLPIPDYEFIDDTTVTVG